jgi:hypothetical protein
MTSPERMRFSSRLLMVITPIGVALGLYEAWFLAGKLAFVVALQILLLAVVTAVVVRTVRRESAQRRPRP